MAGIIISKIKYFSLAKFLTMYGFLLMVLNLLIDLVYRAITGSSYLFAAVSWGAWAIGALELLIAVPIIMFLTGYVFGFIINICLKTTKGLEIETL